MADLLFCMNYLYNNATLVLVFLTALATVYYLTRRPPNVPPGPHIWPIFGNLFSLANKDLLKKLSSLRKKHGNIFSLYIGSELWIFLNGYDVIYDALVKKGRLFSARPADQYTQRLGHSAITTENGTKWKERRTFILSALYQLCVADNGQFIEGVVQNEVEQFKDAVSKISDMTIDPGFLISSSFTNIILKMMYGKRLDYYHEDMKMIISAVEKGFKNFTDFKILSSLIPFTWLPWETLGVLDRKTTNKIRDFNLRMASSAMASSVEEDEQNVLLRYLKVLKSGEINGKPVTDGSFSPESMNDLFQDIQVAGSETSATLTKWILLHLTLNMDLQKKLQKEIDNIVPRDRLPSLGDRPLLPTVEATILEGLRIGMIVPLSTPHAVTEETKFQGYHITKTTTIIPNLSSVFMDPEIFPEPEVFKPERFLDDTGRQVLVPKQMVTFSLGPRSCPGETLARLEVFLFVSAILQHFELRLPKGAEIPSLKGVFAVTYHPQPYKIAFISRDN